MGKTVYAQQIMTDSEIPNTIVRTSTLPEELGRIEYLLSDKTGTLTQNRMTPQNIYADGVLLDEAELDLVNDVQRLLLKAALLASDATTDEEAGTAIGDPTEVALVMIGDRLGVEENTYRAQHPSRAKPRCDDASDRIAAMKAVGVTITYASSGSESESDEDLKVEEVVEVLAKAARLTPYIGVVGDFIWMSRNFMSKRGTTSVRGIMRVPCMEDCSALQEQMALGAPGWYLLADIST